MKKMIIILLMAIMLAGCGTKIKDGTTETQDVSRFVNIEQNSYGWKILVDKETGVMYAVSDGTYNRGIFTLLVDEEGKPLIWEGDDRNDYIF